MTLLGSRWRYSGLNGLGPKSRDQASGGLVSPGSLRKTMSIDIAVTVLSYLLTTVTVKPSSQSSSSSNVLSISIFAFFLFVTATTFTGSTRQGFLTTVRSRCGDADTRDDSTRVAMRNPTRARLTQTSDHKILLN